MGLSGLRAMAWRQALAALRQSHLEAYRAASANSSSYSSPVRAAVRACRSAASGACCCATAPSSCHLHPFLSSL